MGGDDGRVSARVPRETIETDYATENVSLAANYCAQVNRVLRTTSFATRLARMRAGS